MMSMPVSSTVSVPVINTGSVPLSGLQSMSYVGSGNVPLSPSRVNMQNLSDAGSTAGSMGMIPSYQEIMPDNGGLNSSQLAGLNSTRSRYEPTTLPQSYFLTQKDSPPPSSLTVSMPPPTAPRAPEIASQDGTVVETRNASLPPTDQAQSIACGSWCGNVGIC